MKQPLQTSLRSQTRVIRLVLTNPATKLTRVPGMTMLARKTKSEAREWAYCTARLGGLAVIRFLE
jgi:hypothetical protein